MDLRIAKQDFYPSDPGGTGVERTARTTAVSNLIYTYIYTFPPGG